MREIKFRAWDKKKKEWVHDVLIENGGNLGQAYCHSSEGYGGIMAVKNYPNKKNIIVQFYIDLKDKNRKETYEGDLIRFTIPEDVPENERDVRKVIWVDEMCGFQGRTLNDRFDCFLDSKIFEVIGNIYENPEILKDKK